MASRCLIITPEIEKIAKNFPKETPTSICNAIELWQDYQNKLESEYPSQYQLNNFLDWMRNKTDENTVSINNVSYTKIKNKIYVENGILKSQLSSEIKNLIDFNLKIKTAQAIKVKINDNFYIIDKDINIIDSSSGQKITDLMMITDSPFTLKMELKKNFENLLEEQKHKKTNIQSINKNTLSDLYKIYSPVKLQYRIENIARDFQNIYNKKLDALKKCKSNKERQEILKQMMPKHIFNEIKTKYVNATQMSENESVDILMRQKANLSAAQKNVLEKKIRYQYREFVKILNHFDALAYLSCNKINFIFNINIKPTDIYMKIENPQNVTFEFANEELLEYQKEREWYEDFETRNEYLSLSTQIKQILNNLVRKDIYGRNITDDLNRPLYMDPKYVYSILIKNLNTIVDTTSMMEKLNIIKEQYPFINELIDILNNNPSLKTSFFNNFNKKAIKYDIINLQSPYNVFTINLGNRDAFNLAKYNFLNGIVLSKESVYDKNGFLLPDKAKNLLNLLSIISEEIKNVHDKTQRQTILLKKENLEIYNKILLAIGFNVDIKQIKNAIQFNSQPNIFLQKMFLILTKISNSTKSNLTVNDLYKQISSIYRSINDFLNQTESNILTNDISIKGRRYYSYVSPNYVTKLINFFKYATTEEIKAFINQEYKPYFWFYNSETNTWLNTWLKYIDENNSLIINNLIDIQKVVLFNNKAITEMNFQDYISMIYAKYYQEKNSSVANYIMPFISNAGQYYFIRFNKYTNYTNEFAKTEKEKNVFFKDSIADALCNVAIQEIQRILFINKNNKKSNIDIKNFSEKGNRFLFLSFLNGTDNGRSFLKKIQNLKEQNPDSVKQYIKNEITNYMEIEFQNFLQTLKNNNLFELSSDGKTYKYFNEKYEQAKEGQKTNLETNLEELFWNQTFANTQIIQIFSTDLAFYKSWEDFIKRQKGVWGMGLQLDTNANFNGEVVGKRYGQVLYLNDQVKTSIAFNELSTYYKYLLEQNFIDLLEYNNLINSLKNINQTDGQALRSLPSYREISIMTNKWSESKERVYNKIMNNISITKEDFNIIYQPLKAVYYSFETIEINGQKIKSPVFYKCSDIPIIPIIPRSNNKSHNYLLTLNKFMLANNLDAIYFSSAVKVGANNVININTVNDTTSLLNLLNETLEKNTNQNLFHTVDYQNYQIILSFKESLKNGKTYLGVQAKKILQLYRQPISLKTKTGILHLSSEQVQQLLNHLIIQQTISNYTKIQEIFKNDKSLSEYLLTHSNLSFENQQKFLLNLKNEFILSLSDPLNIVENSYLLNNIVKNLIAKINFQGGIVRNTTSFQFSEDLHIVFQTKSGQTVSFQKFLKENPNGTKQDYKKYIQNLFKKGELTVKHFEAYAPPFTTSIEETTYDESKQNYTIEDVPKSLRRMIMYRQPTEGLHSIIPVFIKDFTPSNLGSVVYLPSEITLFLDLDFDGDEMYVLRPSYTIQQYNIEKAQSDFAKAQKLTTTIFNQFQHNPQLIENFNEISLQWDTWFEEHKDEYLLDKPIYIYNSPNLSDDLDVSKLSVAQQRNLLFEIYWNILIHPNNLNKLFNPGNTRHILKSSIIMDLITNPNLHDYLLQNNMITENTLMLLNNKSLEELKKIQSQITLKNVFVVSLNQTEKDFKRILCSNLISIYAPYYSAYEMIVNSDLSLKENESDFILFRKHAYKFCPQTSTNVSIANSIREWQTASLDNNSEDILTFFNQNKLSAPITMFLTYLGFSYQEIGMLLNQPIIKFIIDQHLEKKQYQISPISAKQNILEFFNIAKLSYSYKDIQPSTLTEDVYLQALELNNEQIDLLRKSLTVKTEYTTKAMKQLAIGILFSRILKGSNDFNKLIFLSKTDNLSKTIQSSYAENLQYLHQRELAFQQIYSSISSLKNIYNLAPLKNSEDAFENLKKDPNAYINAITVYGFNQLTEIMGKYIFPYSQQFKNLLHDFFNISANDQIPAQTISSIYNDFIMYRFLQNPFFGTDEKLNTAKKQFYYIYYFPDHLKNMRKKYPSLNKISFIKNLVVSKIPKTDIPILSLGPLNTVIEFSDEEKEIMSSEWLALTTTPNPEWTALAYDLIKYAYYRTGFTSSFKQNNFIHLLPNDLRISIPNYQQTLNDIINDQSKHNNFIEQYIYNHLYDSPLIKDIYLKQSLFAEIANVKTFTLDLNANDSNLQKFFKTDLSSKFPKPINFIRIRNSNQVKFFKLIRYSSENSKVVYQQIYPLGFNKIFLQYDPTVDVDKINNIFSNSKAEKQKEFDTLLEQEQMKEVVTEEAITEEAITEEAITEEAITEVSTESLKLQTEEKVNFISKLLANQGITTLNLSEEQSAIQEEKNFLDDENKPFCNL